MQTRHSKTALLAPLMCKNPYVPEWDWPPQSGLVNSPWVCSSGESRHRWECSHPQCRDLWGTSRCSPRSPPPHWRSGWSLPLHLHVRGDHVQITLQFIKVWSVAMLWSIWWIRSGSALNWLSWIRIWIRTGNADPDPEALTKLTNKIVLLPFKNALYLLRKVHIFFCL